MTPLSHPISPIESARPPQRRTLLLGALGATSAALMGCASAPTPADYAAEKPVLDLRRYFNGIIDAYGVFTDRSGKVVRRFTVLMSCTWNGNQGVLDEDFFYSDGSKEKRIWRLTYQGDGRFTGTAGDVVGTASGQQSGNAFYWAYTLALPVDGRVINVQLDDWMYLIDERTMLNRAVMSKFGIRLGEVLLSFTKRA